MDYYKLNIPIIDVDHPTAEHKDRFLYPKGVEFGYVERDYRLFPEAMFQAPSEMEIIPESQRDAYYDEQEAQKSSLEHIYLSGPNGEPAFVNLDQDGDGYCWMYSSGSTYMLDRLRTMPPAPGWPPKVVRLNPHGPASIIKKGANQGGWCGEAADWLRRDGNGFPVEGTAPGQWPLHSRDYKRYDTPECRAQMALHRPVEEWCDLTRQIYDQNLTRDQVATCGLTNIPGPRDYNWWSHSVCGVRWVRIAKGNWGQLILNSWKGWGRFGLAVLQGSQAVCNGGLAIRMTTASAA